MTIYKVDGIHGCTLVSATTKLGARRTVVDMVRDAAIVTVATQAEIYSAGQRGAVIVGVTDQPDFLNSAQDDESALNGFPAPSGT